jgi:hypothetical protein
METLYLCVYSKYSKLEYTEPKARPCFKEAHFFIPR